MEYRVDSWKWRPTSLLDCMFDTLWVELTFLDVVENSIVCSRFMSIVSIFWFKVSVEVCYQYVQCMSDTIDVYQKPQIHPDIHLRRPICDEMGGTNIGK